MWSLKPNAKLRPTMFLGCGITLVAVMAALVEIQDSRMPRGWQQRRSFLGHTSPIMVVTFSADGQQLASGDFDGNLRQRSGSHRSFFDWRRCDRRSNGADARENASSNTVKQSLRRLRRMLDLLTEDIERLALAFMLAN